MRHFTGESMKLSKQPNTRRPHTPDGERDGFTSLSSTTCETLSPPPTPLTFLLSHFADTFIPSSLHPSLCCPPFLSNSSPFIPNLLQQSPLFSPFHLIMSHLPQIFHCCPPPPHLSESPTRCRCGSERERKACFSTPGLFERGVFLSVFPAAR